MIEVRVRVRVSRVVTRYETGIDWKGMRRRYEKVLRVAIGTVNRCCTGLVRNTGRSSSTPGTTTYAR